jgi:hypothetical protein
MSTKTAPQANTPRRRIVATLAVLAVLAAALPAYFFIGLTFLGCCGSSGGNAGGATAAFTAAFVIGAVLIWLVVRWGWGNKVGNIAASIMVSLAIASLIASQLYNQSRADRFNERYDKCDARHGEGSQEFWRCIDGGS